MTQTQHLAICAAGTGGHVMPGLAVARVMKARGWTLSWVGTTTGMEARLVEKDQIPFTGLAFRGLRGRGLSGLIKGAFALVGAFFKARRTLKDTKVTALFSTGGYVAVPVGLAARSLGLPIVVMNCDADILMSTKALLPLVDRLACGFEGGAKTLAGAKGVVTGNPVRADIMALPNTKERLADRTGPLRLFVFGGSLGAQVFNDVLPEALALMPEGERPAVIHQTGRDRDEAVRAHYARLGVTADVRPFIDDMAREYALSDVVMCRAGATSVAELCAAGVPSILVPFVAKTTAHQKGNARMMMESGAALALDQKEVTAQSLAKLLSELNRDRLIAMGENARALSKTDAAGSVATLIEEVVASHAR